MSLWTECPSYVIDADTPAERRFDAVDREKIDRARDILESIRTEIPPSALKIARWFNVRTRWRFRRELRELADHVGVDWRWLMLANVSYDLTLAYMGCSTVALPTPDGPVLARNLDWWPEDLLAAASCVLRYVQGGQQRFAVAGWPGSVGVVSGMSSRGFAVVLNAVLCTEGHRKTGYPVLLWLRKVLEDADGFDQAVAMLAQQKLFTGALLTVAGTENHQRICIERSPTRVAVRKAGPDEPLVTANDYRVLTGSQGPMPSGEMEQWYGSTCGRYDALLRLSKELLADGRIATEGLLRALTHPDVMQEITAQHVVMRPAGQHIELFVPSRLLDRNAQSD